MRGLLQGAVVVDNGTFPLRIDRGRSIFRSSKARWQFAKRLESIALDVSWVAPSIAVTSFAAYELDDIVVGRDVSVNDRYPAITVELGCLFSGVGSLHGIGTP